jgi:hypothetical protein
MKTLKVSDSASYVEIALTVLLRTNATQWGATTQDKMTSREGSGCGKKPEVA